jgi:flagellar assembly factor FliW
LAFVVLPLDRQGGPIATADLVAACDTLAFDWEVSVVLAIVTLRPEAGRVDFTANLRAPLVIDTTRRLGCQHVLVDEAYPLRHPLPRPGENAP